jgi:hypothetical protein
MLTGTRSARETTDLGREKLADGVPADALDEALVALDLGQHPERARTPDDDGRVEADRGEKAIVWRPGEVDDVWFRGERPSAHHPAARPERSNEVRT